MQEYCEAKGILLTDILDSDSRSGRDRNTKYAGGGARKRDLEEKASGGRSKALKQNNSKSSAALTDKVAESVLSKMNLTPAERAKQKRLKRFQEADRKLI